MRVVHQTRPPVASRVTRSPSRVSFLRNSATAALACCAVPALRWTSSKTITKVRPRRSSSPVFVETLGSEGRAGDAAAAAAVDRSRRHLEQVQAHDRLPHAVLEHLQVPLAEVRDRLPLLVGDDHVDGDLLDAGGEGGSGPRDPGDLLGTGVAREHQNEHEKNCEAEGRHLEGHASAPAWILNGDSVDILAAPGWTDSLYHAKTRLWADPARPVPGQGSPVVRCRCELLDRPHQNPGPADCKHVLGPSARMNLHGKWR